MLPNSAGIETKVSFVDPFKSFCNFLIISNRNDRANVVGYEIDCTTTVIRSNNS